MRLQTLLLKTILVLVLFDILCKLKGESIRRLIPKKKCDKISGVEVRYNEFYELYLGHDADNDQVDENGIVYKSLNKAVNACCPGMELNFTLVNTSVEWLVQKDILHHHEARNNSRLIFYFPEFTSQGNIEVYSHQIPFLKLRKSPGFALVMLKSESHLHLSALDIIGPSWPIFALVLTLSWAVGIIGWALEHNSNPEDFPTPFFRGMFEGFWWAVVTMTTVGYGDKTPKSIFARILCIFWILAGAILLSLFTGNTTSIITANRIEQNSRTMGKKIGVVNMKYFVETELNLGAHILEYTKVESALNALSNKTIDRLLFPHYLDLLYLMSDPYYRSGLFSDIYIAKELDKSYQIGMVLSHPDASSVRNDDFYTCLEIMTSRFASELDYNYSRIDDSIIVESQSTFDTDVTQQYLYAILGVVGVIVILGAAFDIYNHWHKSGKMREQKSSDTKMHSQEETISAGAARDLQPAGQLRLSSVNTIKI